MTDLKRHLATPLIFDDEPVERDEAAYFQFEAYANTLARLIAAKTTRTPLTIGVFGEWGTGKATLLREITGQACNRVYRADDVLMAIDEPLEQAGEAG